MHESKTITATFSAPDLNSDRLMLNIIFDMPANIHCSVSSLIFALVCELFCNQLQVQDVLVWLES